MLFGSSQEYAVRENWRKYPVLDFSNYLSSSEGKLDDSSERIQKLLHWCNHLIDNIKKILDNAAWITVSQ